MEQFVPEFDTFETLTEKKKTEKEHIAGRFQKYNDKIAKLKRELHDIDAKDEPAAVKNVRSKIKKVEIEIAKTELDIAQLRAKKLKLKGELKD